MNPRDLAAELASAVRAAVRPRLGYDREVVGVTASGDTTFAIDRVAEDAVTGFIAERRVSAALFSEDGGLVGDPHADWLLVVDPIDGSRPARAGLESCCVSVALAPNRPGATLGDVAHAAVYEIKHDRLFLASRGEGVAVLDQGRPQAPAPSARGELAGAALSFEIAGRPVEAVAGVLGEVVDGSSLAGGAFAFASTTFSLTRLVTGQLDAHADVADRIRRERPDWEPRFLRAGQGRIIALYVYDLAGVLLVAREAGVTVTDAWGRSLAGVPLTDTSLEWHCSCVAAGNAALHGELLAAIERGMLGLRALGGG